MTGFLKMITDSWKLFKINFKTILILFVLLSAIPSLILTYIGLPMLNLSSPTSFYSTNQGIMYIILGAVFSLLSALLTVSIIDISFSAKKQNYKTALSSGSKYWISYILLMISLFIATMLLLIPAGIAFYFAIPLKNIPLIILGLILFLIPIYFIIKVFISPIILVGENKGVFASIKRSFEITRKKFWKIILYLILMVVALMLISAVINLIGFLINTLTGNISMSTDVSTNLPSSLLTPAGLFINQIFSLASSLITLPVSLFFLKNLYSRLTEKKK